MKANEKNKVGLYFYELVRQNEAALSHLSNIRLKYLESCREPWKAKSGKITKEYDRCVGAIKGMEQTLTSLSKTINGSYGFEQYSPKETVAEAIKTAEKMGITPVLDLEALLDGIKPISEETKILNELNERVEKLNINLEEIHYYPYLSIKTLHDCIRYLHQRAIDELFNNGYDSKEANPKFSMIYGNASDTEMKIIDLTKQGITGLSDFCFFFSHKKNPNYHKNLKEENIPLPIRAIFHSYDELGELNTTEISNHNEQEIKIVALEDSILAQIRLGAHYAKLESKIDDEDSFISLSYNDTACRFAENRMGYLKIVLQKMGYAVDVKDKNLRATLYQKPKKRAYKTLCETIRLLNSSNDLDITSNIQGRELEAACRFLNEETLISETLFRSKKMDEKKCRTFMDNYQFNWEDVEI